VDSVSLKIPSTNVFGVECKLIGEREEEECKIIEKAANNKV